MSLAKDFKEFIGRGNVLDLAVAVVIGAAFGQIITSLVNDMLMPIIGSIFGGLNFSALSLRIGDANIMYGNFLQSIVNFLIIAFCIFIVVRIANRFVKQKKADSPSEAELLAEIRDLLKKK